MKNQKILTIILGDNSLSLFEDLNILEKELMRNNISIYNYNNVEINKPSINRTRNGKLYRGRLNNNEIVIYMIFVDSRQDRKLNQNIEALLEMRRSNECEGVQKFYGVTLKKKENEYNLYLIFQWYDGLNLRNVLLKNEFNLKEKIYFLQKVVKIFSDISKLCLHKIHVIMPDDIIVNDQYKFHFIIFKNFHLFEDSYYETPFMAQYPVFYYAPELFELDNEKNTSSTAKDKFNRVCIWMVGVIISELISGIIPWHNVSSNETKVKLFLNKKKPFPIPEIVDEYPAIKELIGRCTLPNSQDRCDIDYVLDCLNKFMYTISTDI
jgi:serine/threonine protein kinase